MGSDDNWARRWLDPEKDLEAKTRETQSVRMKNAWLEEAQAGIKIVWINNNNFSYADDTTLMAESEEELKSLLMKVRVE